MNADDALAPGRWVAHRGVLRWQAEPERPVLPGKPLTELIACPYCRAKVTETCKSASGNPRVPHASRLAPRLCPCGEIPATKRLMCERCRAAARAQTYRLRERRKPTRQRRKVAA